MADSDKTLELLIKLGVVGKSDVEAANDLLLKTTKTNNDALDESKGKWEASRREIREVGNELGRVTGISRLGGLFLGGAATAAFAAAGAIKLFGDTFKTLQDSIKGPIEIGLPDDAADHISAAAEAWNRYAEARAKVIGADAEKKLREKTDNPDADAFRLEIDARRKSDEALGIKTAPENVREANQKALDANAAAGENALKVLRDQMEMVARQRAAASGNNPSEYEGSYGILQKSKEAIETYARYPGMSFDDIQRELQQRVVQAQQQVHSATSYRDREESASKRKGRLMEEAGTEAGEASVIRADMVAAASRTAEAARHLGTVTTDGFKNITDVLADHARKISTQTEQIKNFRNHNSG